MKHTHKVFMRLSQCEIQTKCMIVLQKTSLVDSTSKVRGSILMSVSLSNKGKSLKLKRCEISRTYFQEQEKKLIYI